MLAASRSLFRFDHARSLTNTYIMKCCFFSDMDKGKQKVVVNEWRPRSTRANSSESEAISSQSRSDRGKSVMLGNDDGKVSKGKSVTGTKKHSVTMEVGASLMRFVKGNGGVTQKKLEEELEVKLVFPSSREDDNIVIEGNSTENVSKAEEKIQSIIDEAVKSPSLDYSHFVSLPLAIYPELVDKLFNFQNSLLGTIELNQEMGIEKSIFINPKTFHLTVLMLKLWNKDRVKAATEVLQNVLPKVLNALDGRPLSVRLKGLRCMRPPLAKARILYCPVEEVGDEDRLSRACQVIIEAFVEAGLVLEKDARQKLLLHATVMNARHRKRKKGTRNVDSFDARGIMEQYGSHEWGKYLIREAHLSRRFVYDESGYYRRCASIPFPKNK